MKIKYFDKHLDLLALSSRPRTRLLALEGSARSSKTVMVIQAFYYRVYHSENQLHMIAGRDLSTINNNLLHANGAGLLEQFPSCKLASDKIGSNYIELPSPNGIKKILLCGYSDKTKWTKLLGSTLDTIFVDEVNIANKQFIEECFSRQVSVDYPMTFWTLNGDVPSNWIYQEYINRCKIIGGAPASIRADMDKFDKTKYWYYTHWTMKDNPAMTPEKIATASAIYPRKSYYYTTKILGERGTPGKLIYIDYIDEEKLLSKIDIGQYHEFEIGVDVGASRAKNSFVLVGFNYDYTKVAIIDKVTFQQAGYVEKTNALISFVERCKQRNISIRRIEVDNAEQNYIVDLTAKFQKLGLPQIYACYKSTIKQRIDLVIILLASGKIQFNDTEEGRNALLAYKLLAWKDGDVGLEREDNNEWFNDVADSIEYVLTRHMARLLRSND